jgi:hypothetical protein
LGINHQYFILYLCLDISHSNINLQIVCAGGMFPHCKDKDGKPLFIVKVKSSVKGAYKSEEVHKVLGK